MKIFSLLFAAVLTWQISYSQVSITDFNKLHWLEGEWNRVNVKPGRSGHERWIKVSDHELKGWGITMKGSDTAFVEKLQLITRDNKIYYVADTPENKEPVYFALTLLSENSFECENPAHDFPKKIAYYRTGNSIKATISGDGKSMDYLFEKK
jgi:hypothetical protein